MKVQLTENFPPSMATVIISLAALSHLIVPSLSIECVELEHYRDRFTRAANKWDHVTDMCDGQPTKCKTDLLPIAKATVAVKARRWVYSEYYGSCTNMTNGIQKCTLSITGWDAGDNKTYTQYIYGESPLRVTFEWSTPTESSLSSDEWITPNEYLFLKNGSYVPNFHLDYLKRIDQK